MFNEQGLETGKVSSPDIHLTLNGISRQEGDGHVVSTTLVVKAKGLLDWQHGLTGASSTILRRGRWISEIVRGPSHEKTTITPKRKVEELHENPLDRALMSLRTGSHTLVGIFTGASAAEVVSLLLAQPAFAQEVVQEENAQEQDGVEVAGVQVVNPEIAIADTSIAANAAEANLAEAPQYPTSVAETSIDPNAAADASLSSIPSEAINGTSVHPDLSQMNNIIANAELVDLGQQLQDRAFVYNASGPVVVLSQTVKQNLIAELAGQGITQPNYEQLAQLVNDGRWDFTASDLTSRTIFIEDNQIYAMGNIPNRPKVLSISNGDMQPITYSSGNAYYKPSIQWMDGLGLVLTDGYTITRQFNPNSQSFAQLENYIPLGTTEQRFRRSINNFLTGVTVDPNMPNITNPLALDPAEVQKYLATGQTEGYQSFVILKNNRAEPIAVVGTTGFAPQELADIKKAWERLNQIDPNMTDLLSLYGVRGIGSNIGNVFGKHPNFSTTFESYLGIICINEVEPQYKPRSYEPLIGVLAGEARAIRDYRLLKQAKNGWTIDSPYVLAPNSEWDKGLWLQQVFIEPNRNKFIGNEYGILNAIASTSIRYGQTGLYP